MHWSRKYNICLKGVKVEHSRKEVFQVKNYILFWGVMRVSVELYWNQIGTDNSGYGRLPLLHDNLFHCCVSVRQSCV